jgi:hypothetical protein
MGKEWALGGRPALTLTLVLVSVICSSAQGGARPRPWDGGDAVVTPFEARAGAIASKLAGARVSVRCVDNAIWRALGDQHSFEPAQTWALTPFRWDAASARPAPARFAIFSPRTCALGAAFASKPRELGARTCPVNGGRAASSPRVVGYGDCDDWPSKLVAVHVLAHEAMHLHGVRSEAVADCLAAQLDAYVAAALGAHRIFARSMARELWDDFYVVRDRTYRAASCHDGGELDLFPDRPGWPTPNVYPADVSTPIGALEVDDSPPKE